jgi:short-subunit dehydrogenase involved in D-alanine esterification of teichoic acids
MTTAAAFVPTRSEPELLGQTVVVLGGSSGIGLATAQRARAEGADVLITGRHSEALESAALDLHAIDTAVFDANDVAALDAFFEHIELPIDHVMVTAGAPTTRHWPTWTSMRRAARSRSV